RRAAKRRGRPSAEAAGPRTRRWTARAAVFTRARFADGKGPAVEHLPVELLNRLFGVCAIQVFHECKPPGSSGLAIDWQDDLRWRRNGAEVGSEIPFGRGVRKIADKQTDSQSTLA